MPPISNLPVPGGGQALQFQRFSPDQLQILEQLRSGGTSGLQALQGLSFDPIEQRAREQFQQRTVPSIAERFMGLGSNVRSGRLVSDLGKAGSDLESSLAALRSQYGLQQHGNLLNQLQLGLQPQYENVYSPPGPGFGSQLAGGLGQGIASVLPMILLSLATGGTGAAAGAGISGGLMLLKSLLGGGQ